MVRSFSVERVAGADTGAVETIKHAATRVAVILACLLASASIASAADNVIKSSYESFAKFLRSIGNSETINHIVRLKNDGRPFTLHVLPSERSAITARLEPPTRYVEIFKGCIEEWCHVHLGLSAGWIRKDRLRLPEAREVRNEDQVIRNEAQEIRNEAQEIRNVSQDVPNEIQEARNEEIADVQEVSVASVNAVNIPLPIRKAPLQPKTLQASVPPLPASGPPLPSGPIAQDVKQVSFRQTTERNIAAFPSSNIVDTSLKLAEIPKKLYSLANVEDITFLPVREDRSDDAPILGGIPFFANNVEALGLCVNEWCLVRYGENLRGWIRQRHLSDTHKENTPRLQLQNTKEQTAVALYDEPDQRGEVASFIDPQATGIVPTGTCDLDWCHVLHDGKIGWIKSSYLARQ
jgi:SH3-like domain-containing protein